ncbi:Lysophospholipase, alpha-beta hydrolase superfamily [Bryocella elongata]|uniref:Lysophospholipase, alpha-beta hydrolase superfamily n=1 Tax=Bryocella elongata TaxID=863522 RepID=A0A1H5WV31_9BACT|nr:alpha/beta hydrolase [Bryocella elongata]SEG03304.1 Lysophospholipase, alpha-beta hydrolase superfamily [Bryocella elongata]
MSKTIMLIHGAWVTTHCWDGFRDFFEAQNYTVVVPAWPFMDRPVDALRNLPDPRVEELTIKDLVDHFDNHIRSLPEDPILIGHSFGGLIVQMLLDRGLGAAGVAIDAGPPRGVLPSPTAIKSALPVLLAWRGWSRVLSMSFKGFSTTFANTLIPSQQRDTYAEHIVPAPGRIYFQAALGLGNAVNFKNPKRPPLLLTAAAEDRTSTPSMVRAMYRKHCKAPSQTDILEFANRSHWLIAEPGWEEVAGAILKWICLNTKG